MKYKCNEDHEFNEAYTLYGLQKNPTRLHQCYNSQCGSFQFVKSQKRSYKATPMLQ